MQLHAITNLQAELVHKNLLTGATRLPNLAAVASKCAIGFCRPPKLKRLVDSQVVNLHTQVTPVLWRLGGAPFGEAGFSFEHRYGKPYPVAPSNAGKNNANFQMRAIR